MTGKYKVTPEQTAFFNDQGYLLVKDIISAEEVLRYSGIYDKFLDGTIDAGKNRADLGIGMAKSGQVEAITQIMWPSDFMPALLEMSFHHRVLSISRDLLGKDMDFDFDMLISKAPGTNSPTPWHQDAAYWINMPDTRAVSCWMTLDDSTKENGCMWYVPGSHKLPLRPHRFAGKVGGALMCDCSEEEGLAIEIKPGSCIFHHGHTLHYSRGNSTPGNRRAFIINLRPETMIALEREKGYDHGRGGNAADRQLRNQEIK
ncbi:MAG: phytanoyl-CoA dioxygenase family protein [Prolixibacteraceae bacterium]|jgi:ectoine hydroxylase-related dioxygenase (phytanoyl-CoA dioxygenase family)|nr:phytanoyl-CoA dioxygenase family protein [Prolixibacteraceae bacterium]